MKTLVLADDRTRVALVPALGGGIAEMSALLPGDGQAPVLRPWSGRAEDGPFALASNVLVPFSNRISGGGFAFEGTFHDIEPNLNGEPFPIHGDGFQREWVVVEAADTAARLVLMGGAIGPFRYDAIQMFELVDGTLTVKLDVTNTGETSLPFGAGFHPWFPRTAGTTLCFRADHVWLEDARYLPTEHVPVTQVPNWDFSAGAALPAGWINNAFTEWVGSALVVQPDLGINVAVAASANLTTAIVYSPGAEADFFCFEPVSHPVDAFNQPEQPGLKVLAPGESLHAEMTIGWVAAG